MRTNTILEKNKFISKQDFANKKIITNKLLTHEHQLNEDRMISNIINRFKPVTINTKEQYTINKSIQRKHFHDSKFNLYFFTISG